MSASSLFQASDADNNSLTYFFYDNSADPTSGHFTVHGVVQAAGTTFAVSAAQLAQTTFTVGTAGTEDLFVNVWDGMSFSGPQEFHIGVAPNHAPVIASNGGGGTAAVNVAENSTAVTTVIASDADPLASLSYTIAGGADAALFSINATTGVLSFVSAPNAESPQDAGGNNVYDVTVQVSDGAATDSQAIAVTVTDVNEFAPSITSTGGGATATANVAENTAAVTTVTASDADLSASLSYSVSGGADAALFSINSITGALSFLTAHNAESPQDAGGNNVYDVTVHASDGTTTDSQAIAVTVTDVNEPPVITSNGGGGTAAVNVAENSTAVTTVIASDADQLDSLS
jgi:predicted hotdog family 3-hydroxylacyl-ACP dehydratase